MCGHKPTWATMLNKARELDVATAVARKDTGEAYFHWLGADLLGQEQERMSTAHMCANVWRAAAHVAGWRG